ncbi:hypothetical protein L2E82_49653 [Cichorium intybus]|uniref:Uncharacterized protein n=1 Tax=Cichorium intybus TaxID=13427 RepID=A0ACB8Z005_CICIN|nr:hypothetical protein L2E82_49653 [Cichorium intybus]
MFFYSQNIANLISNFGFPHVYIFFKIFSLHEEYFPSWLYQTIPFSIHDIPMSEDQPFTPLFMEEPNDDFEELSLDKGDIDSDKVEGPNDGQLTSLQDFKKLN